MFISVGHKVHAYNLLASLLPPTYLANPMEITLFPVRGGDK